MSETHGRTPPADFLPEDSRAYHQAKTEEVQKSALRSQTKFTVESFEEIRRDIEAGRLKVCLKQFPRAPPGIYARYAPTRYLAAKTPMLIDFTSRCFSRHPECDGFA